MSVLSCYIFVGTCKRSHGAIKEVIERDPWQRTEALEVGITAKSSEKKTKGSRISKSVSNWLKPLDLFVIFSGLR